MNLFISDNSSKIVDLIVLPGKGGPIQEPNLMDLTMISAFSQSWWWLEGVDGEGQLSPSRRENKLPSNPPYSYTIDPS